MANNEIQAALPTQQHDQPNTVADADNDYKFAEMITGLKTFTFEELQSATDDFSASKMLGEGSYGQVFHGLLGAKHIAVKRLLQNEWVEDKDKEVFIREIQHMATVNHQNILSPMGFCLHGPTPLLVTERLHSLHKALYEDTNHLNWTTRFQIALGVANGLACLHTGARRPMLHCDIKPGNILLHPENLARAYIADFGVAHLLAHHQSAESGEEIEANWYYGTLGYWAPEVKVGKRLSTKTDVYSFGKLLYALVSGNENVHDMPASLIRKPKPPRGLRKCFGMSGMSYTFIYLPYIRVRRNNMIERTVAPCLVDEVGGSARALMEASTVLRLIVLCTQDEAKRRPSMETVRMELQTATWCRIKWSVKIAVFVGIQRFRWLSAIAMFILGTVMELWSIFFPFKRVGVYAVMCLPLLSMANGSVFHELVEIASLIYWSADEI